jgi:hypothetical protein
MITVKQILEQYDIVTDKASSHDLYLADLASSGIIEEEKIPMLRRSLNKNINEMTVAEKKSLVSLIESLMANVIVEKSGGAMSYPSDKDMPTVIILKRKAIRVFPDNQKIGLYYSQALDRYISIPFGPNVKDLSPQLNEAYAPRGQSYSPGKRQSDEEKKKTATPPVLPILSRIRQRTQKLTVEPKEKAPEKSRVERYLKAKPPERRKIEKSGAPSTMEISKETGANPFDILMAKAGARFGDAVTGRAKTQPAPSNSTPVSNPSQRVVGGSASPPPKAIPVKESFRENLRSIREERQLDEVSWEDVKSGAKKAAEFAGDVTGISDVASAVGKAKEGDYSGAAWDAAKGVGKGILTVGTGGAASAGIRGAIAGVRALRAGRGVAAAARTAKRSAITSKGGRLAGGIVRGAGKLATGAATLGAAALSGLGDAFKTEPTGTDYSSFGNVTKQTPVSAATSVVPGASGIEAQKRALGQMVASQQYSQRSVQENNNILTLKQIVENNVPSQQLQIGEETISINKSIAKKIVKLHESLNRTNKKKLERMLNEDIVSFRKVVNFALK